MDHGRHLRPAADPVVSGRHLKIDATTAAFTGISILLITGVLTWKDLADNASAWSTLVFFGVLVGMAAELNALGVIDWIGKSVAG
jgi:divalent anion:Na+ symporter, DASS family